MWKSEPMPAGWEVAYEAWDTASLHQVVEQFHDAGIDTHLLDDPSPPLGAGTHRVRIAVPGQHAAAATALLDECEARHEANVRQLTKELHREMRGPALVVVVLCLGFWILTGNPFAMAGGGALAIFLLYFWIAIRSSWPASKGKK